MASMTAENSSGGKTVSTSSGAANVKKLRIGEHTDKTRIVFDLNRMTSYRYDLDNNEKLLIVEFPDAAWSARTQWSSSKAPLLASYSVQPMDNGTGSRIIIQLKKTAGVVYEDTLKGPPRIVIDVAAN